ncbi:MAG: type II secretion system protein [Phycisphaerae bacterium]
MNRRAFSLVELIIAIFILGIGMISIAALFPAGIKQQEIAEDDVYGPLVAKHAMELLRTRLKQEDFGSFEDFSSDTNTVRDPVPLQSSTNVGTGAVASTIAKDWIWKRPGFITVDDASSTGCDEAGMYDIFSYYSTRKNVGGNRSGTTKPLIPTEFTPTTLLSDVAITTTGRNRLYGIPYNRRIYDELFDVTQPNYAWTYAQNGIPASGSIPNGNNLSANALREPAVFITQRERYWPMPSNAVGVTPTPKYVWDCMFRKFNGRILVGMFVYRVLPANGLRGGNYSDNNGQTMGTPYVSAQVTASIDSTNAPLIANYPPIPQWVSSRSPMSNLSLTKGDGFGNKWGAGGIDAKVGSTMDTSKYSPNRDDCGIPGTGPSTTTLTDPTALTYSETWQQPGQWMIDQYNNVHHVIEGRRTHDDGPVILAKPVPRQPYSNSLFDAKDATERSLNTAGNKTVPVPPATDSALLATPGSGGDALKGIQDLWFVPPYDANGNQLLPVFACVEEL